MQGVTTHVSSPKSNTDWTKYLNKNPDTCGLTPPLLSILDIIHQIICAIFMFQNTACQSSSATNSTLPRYFNHGTISRARP